MYKEGRQSQLVKLNNQYFQKVTGKMEVIIPLLSESEDNEVPKLLLVRRLDCKAEW